MRGAIKAVTAAMVLMVAGIFAQRMHGPKYKQQSTKGWGISTPSPYFGKRKKPVLAIMKDGSKKPIALKNALKKNLDFTTI